MNRLLIITLLLAVATIISCASCKKESRNNGQKEMHNLRNSSGNALDLTPIIDIRNDSTVIFNVDAVRNYEAENEYIPDSQLLNVKIISEKGAVLWDSGKDKAFMQVVSAVLPTKTGDKYRYSVEWNGKRNNGSALSPGVYKVILTIPAKPKSYTTTTELKWKTK